MVWMVAQISHRQAAGQGGRRIDHGFGFLTLEWGRLTHEDQYSSLLLISSSYLLLYFINFIALQRSPSSVPSRKKS
jgi:hypothetical protein